MATNTTPRGALTATAAINGVGLAGTDYVRHGVVDQSGYFAGQAEALGERNKQLDLQLAGSGIQAAGDAAMLLGKGYVLHGLEQEVQGLVDNYTAVSQSPLEMAGLEMTSNSLWSNLGDESKPSKISDINAVEEKHAAHLTKLKRAYEQGAITSLAELETRVLAATRQAVNRTPGLASEIMNHTAQILHLSGVRGMVNPLEEAQRMEAQQQQKTLDRLIKFHDTNKIPYDIQNPDIQSLSESATRFSQSYQARQEFNAAVQEGERIDKANVKAFVREVVPHLSYTYHSEANNLAQEIFSNGMPYDVQKKVFQDRIAGIKRRVNEEFTRSGAYSLGEGKEAHEQIMKNLDDYSNSTVGFTSGEEALKYMKIKTEYTNATDLADLQTMVSIPAGKFLNTISPIASQLQLKKMAPMVSKLTEGIVNLNLSKMTADMSEVKEGVPDFTMFTGAMMKSGDLQHTTKAFQAVAKYMSENPDDVDITTKLTAHYKELADSGYKGKLLNGDQSLIRPFNATTELYLSRVGEMYRMALREANSAGLRATRDEMRFNFPQVESAIGLGAEGDISARGTIASNGYVDMKVTNDPTGKVGDRLFMDIANRFNDVIKTYANLMNVSSKEASDVIMSQYGHLLDIPPEELPKPPQIRQAPATTGKRGQNENNPLNLKEVGQDRFRAFTTKEEGIQASFAQLLKYHDGSSSNVDFPLTTPELMLRKWNNQAEKGSASDSQYAANVARFSGINLKEPIDRNDLNSWADLIYGMAIAEGAKGITRNEIRRSIGA